MQPLVSPYGNAWRGIRAQVLHEEPRCRACGAPAQAVDHIRPIALGGMHDRANLQALCKRCHRYKTTKEATARTKGRGIQISRP